MKQIKKVIFTDNGRKIVEYEFVGGGRVLDSHYNDSEADRALTRAIEIANLWGAPVIQIWGNRRHVPAEIYRPLVKA